MRNAWLVLNQESIFITFLILLMFSGVTLNFVFMMIEFFYHRSSGKKKFLTLIIECWSGKMKQIERKKNSWRKIRKSNKIMFQFVCEIGKMLLWNSFPSTCSSSGLSLLFIVLRLEIKKKNKTIWLARKTCELLRKLLKICLGCEINKLN